jgi:type II secretory pathway component PulJ
MTKRNSQLGMSLIEVMVVLLITTIITGAIFTQIETVQQRTSSEQVKLDLFQEARDFMDQMTRDLHELGYPNPKNFAPGQLTGPNDAAAAVGLVKADINELRFEGDVNGDGSVESLVYQLVTTGDNCPCLRRSEIPKQAGDPLTGQGTPTWYTEVQNVQNGTSASPIFHFYSGGGTEVDLSGGAVAWDTTNATAMQTIASIDTIKIVITTQAKYPDPKTGTRPSTTLVSTIRLNNCSQAANGKPMSCQ